VSVGVSTIGLELDTRLATQVEHLSELLGAIALICVGIAIQTKPL
jgi:hypothetical protein